MLTSRCFLKARSKMANVLGTDNKTYKFQNITNPEVWLEMRVSGILSGTSTTITLDSRFLACTVIDVGHPLHVVATPTSAPGTASFWVDKGTTTVIIHGSLGTAFDVLISAKRRNYEDVSFEEEPMEFIYEGSIEVSILNLVEYSIDSP